MTIFSTSHLENGLLSSAFRGFRFFIEEVCGCIRCSDGMVRSQLVAPPNNDYLPVLIKTFILAFGKKFEELHTQH